MKPEIHVLMDLQEDEPVAASTNGESDLVTVLEAYLKREGYWADKEYYWSDKHGRHMTGKEMMKRGEHRDQFKLISVPSL
jgi:hypothetical protein